MVADSWGDSTYDSAGRLHTVKYPTTLGSTITETDGYDAEGNRLTISDTGGVSGTVLVTNTYDLADELTTSLNKVGSSQPLTTTYTYDANGNQIIASGPSFATVNTYNLQNQLIQVQGPTTDLQLVYDGQGDRLRSYEQLVPTPVIVNEVQDLVGAPGNRVNTGAQPLPDGLSDLASDGTQDYLYLQPGSGMAPAMGYNGSHATYLAIDTLGSVRLATDPSNAVLGEAAYDAWGNIQASNGSTLLHGLQGSSPFGYAGQYYDPGPGTYAMRARTYNPATGQFESEDPLAYDPQVPVTLNPYEYAGDVPDLITDPSGRGWTEELPGTPDQQQELAIQVDINRNHGAIENPIYTTEYDVPLYTTRCVQPQGIYMVGILSLAPDHHSGYFWDIEHVQAYTQHPGAAAIASGIKAHLALPLLKGTQIDWGNCPYAPVFPSTGAGTSCPDVHVINVSGVQPATQSYLQYFGLDQTNSYSLSTDHQSFRVHELTDLNPDYELMTWTEPQQTDVILFDRFKQHGMCMLNVVYLAACAFAEIAELPSKMAGIGPYNSKIAALREEANQAEGASPEATREILALEDAAGEDTLGEDLTQTRDATEQELAAASSTYIPSQSGSVLAEFAGEADSQAQLMAQEWGANLLSPASQSGATNAEWQTLSVQQQQQLLQQACDKVSTMLKLPRIPVNNESFANPKQYGVARENSGIGIDFGKIKKAGVSLATSLRLLAEETRHMYQIAVVRNNPSIVANPFSSPGNQDENAEIYQWSMELAMKLIPGTQAYMASHVELDANYVADKVYDLLPTRFR